jgi:hypothetical protein
MVLYISVYNNFECNAGDFIALQCRQIYKLEGRTCFHTATGEYDCDSG